MEIKCQLDATGVFITDLITCSTCVGHHYAGAQDYYTVVAACGIWCCGFQVVGLVCCWGLCVRFAGCCCTFSGTTMPFIRSSRLLYSGCCLWYLVLWFSSCWLELRVMCLVCRMLLYLLQASLFPSSGAQDYYTVVAACGIWCFGFQVVGLMWSWGLCVRVAGCCCTFSGTTMPFIRSSRLLYSGCWLWYLVLWFSSCWSGVELRVMCPVCRMLLYLFEASLCPSSRAQEYYTVVAACGIWCCGFLSCWSDVELGLCVRFAGCCCTFSGITMPFIRSSRLLYSGCCLWYLVLWFSSRWSGVLLRVMFGKPRCRWVDSIGMEIAEIGWEGEWTGIKGAVAGWYEHLILKWCH